jgi:hypothetical protein
MIMTTERVVNLLHTINEWNRSDDFTVTEDGCGEFTLFNHGVEITAGDVDHVWNRVKQIAKESGIM